MFGLIFATHASHPYIHLAGHACKKMKIRAEAQEVQTSQARKGIVCAERMVVVLFSIDARIYYAQIILSTKP